MDEFDEPIALSNGFFQSLISDTCPPGIQPVLQLIESRYMPSANIMRLRLSDGLFSYANCAVDLEAGERLEAEGYKDSHGIIKVTDFVRSITSGKVGFSILSFVPVQLTNTIIGEPKPHSGNPDEYKGIENFPQVMNLNANNGQSPGRKRGLAVQNAPTPTKRQSTMPSGGVFGDGLLEIAMITPYVSKFRICGSVSFKEPQRTINTKRGPSLVFSFVLTDTAGNSIKITAFGKESEKFSDLIQEGGAFYVTCIGTTIVREANRRYNSTGHTYEITLNSQCEIEICNDRDIGTPPCKLNCIPLLDLKNHANECVDVLAVVDKVDDVVNVTIKATQKLVARRNVVLIDDSCTQIQFTLWGDEHVESITPDNVGHVYGIKGASVREYNGGFSLSATSAIKIIAAPEGDRTTQLYKWYVEERANAQVGSLTAESNGAYENECRAIGPVNDTNLDGLDRGMFVTIEAFINVIKSETIAYMACSNGDCRKKVTAEANQWSCPTCGIRDEFRWMYMVTLEIADFSGLVWCSMFDEAAQMLFGMKANELMELQASDRAAYDLVFQKIRFKVFEFRVRVSSETYNDQKRNRWNVNRVTPINSERYVKILKKTLNICHA